MATRKGSDNRFPLVRVVEDAIDSDPTPTGELHLRSDEATSTFYSVDDAGTVLPWLTSTTVITKAIVDAKGDLIAASASDTVARLPVGTNGHVLTADSGETLGLKWAAGGGSVAELDDVGDVNAPSPSDGDVLTWDSTPGEWVSAAPTGGGGGLVLLEQHTASGSSSLDFTTFISSTYDEYMIDLVGIIPATDAVSLIMRVGTGGGPTYDAGNNYAYQVLSMSGAATPGNRGSTANSGILLAPTLSNNVAFGPFCGTIRAMLLQSTASPKTFTGTWYWASNAPAVIAEFGGGQHYSLTAATALRFIMSSGNIASGTIRIYGVEK